MIKTKTHSVYDDKYTWWEYAVVTAEYAAEFSFVIPTVMTMAEFCYLPERERGTALLSVSCITVHTPAANQDYGCECNYFGLCDWREWSRWGDKKWIIDNAVPDEEEFDGRVFARLEMYAQKQTERLQ